VPKLRDASPSLKGEGEIWPGDSSKKIAFLKKISHGHARDLREYFFFLGYHVPQKDGRK